ncbi:hypothetical protein ACOJBO_27585 [Rhizobium beringeri]
MPDEGEIIDIVCRSASPLGRYAALQHHCLHVMAGRSSASRSGSMRRYNLLILCAFLTVAIAIVSLRYVTNFWLLSFVYSFQVHLGVVFVAASLVVLTIKKADLRLYPSACLALSRRSRGDHAARVLAG